MNRKLHTAEQLFEALTKSKLLSARQLKRARKEAAALGHPRRIGRWMVERRWVSRWQLERLLAGDSQFHIGKYRLLKIRGKGGMGTVFKAYVPGTQRTVAIKVISKEHIGSARALSRFEREIRAVASLNHPNIIAAYDADVVGDSCYLVLEYFSARSLRTWILEHQPLPIPWCCECIHQAALGLQHAYDKGLVHRDINPSNLLVRADSTSDCPKLKILDFGLARFASETEVDGRLTSAGTIVGTLDYMAPEQARMARGADVRSDIFGLGCTYFEALTGRLPFDGQTAAEKLMSRALEDAPPASRFRREIPAEIDAVVAKMLARDPAQRYQTPTEVANAVSPYAINESPAAAPSGRGSSDFDIDEIDDAVSSFFEQLQLEPKTKPSMRRRKPGRKREMMIVGGVFLAYVLLLAILFFFR